MPEYQLPMDPDTREKEIFFDALDIPSDSERITFIDRICGDDHALKERVARLIQLHAQSDALMDEPVFRAPNRGSHTTLENVGMRIGPYYLEEAIGEGGFGVVFLATQETPVRRKVALKVVKPGMDSRQVLARFDAERQALALMDHPGIARVYDAGATEFGRPYFVMELVEGLSITKYCDRNMLNLTERLRLFVLVCNAIQHAHQRGVIHRDIKPSNILIATQGGQPVPKIIDFGVAKALNQRLTEQSMVTTGIFMLGTPMYMSPEQADVGSVDVDIRTDVYSLGALLYELITGSAPIDRERIRRASYDEIRRMIQLEEPPRPSARIGSESGGELNSAVHGPLSAIRFRSLLSRDLDWIVMKAIAKDRDRRYDTVERLSEDIRRFLDGEGVAARPPSVMYRIQKLASRHRGALIMSLFLLLAACVGLSISSLLILEQRDIARQEAGEAEAARLETLREKEIAVENVYYGNIQVAYQDWQGGQIRRMLDLLGDLRPKFGERDLRGWEWYYLQSLCHLDTVTIRGHSGDVSAIASNPQNPFLAFASHGDSTVEIWDLKSVGEIASLQCGQDYVNSLSWSPDGKTLASGAWEGSVVLWDPHSGSPLHKVTCGAGVLALAWNPVSRMLAASGYRDIEDNSEDGMVWIIDGETGAVVRELIGNVGIVRSLAWDPTGTFLAAGENWQGHLQIWEPETSRLVRSFQAHDHFISALAWSPDGKRLASGSQSDAIRVFNTADWSLANDIPRSHKGRVNAVCWNSASNRLASAGLDGLVKIWDLSTNSTVTTMRGHQGAVTSIYWSEGDETLVTGSVDGTVKVWELDNQVETRDYIGRYRFDWSPDGKRIATRSAEKPSYGEKHVQIIDVESSQVLSLLSVMADGFIVPLAISPDGRRLAAGMWRPGRIVVWDLESGTVELDTVTHGFELRSVDWSSDGSRLLTGGKDGCIRVWDMATLECVMTIRACEDQSDWVERAVWQPHGAKFAVSSGGHGVSVWSAESGTALLTLGTPKANSGGPYSIDWSPDGDRLAYGRANGEFVVIDAETGEERFVASGISSSIRAIAWSPDGTRIASGGYDRQLKIWDAANGRELFSYSGSDESIECVFWAPDGRRIAFGTPNGTQILDATSGYAAERSNQHREVERP